MPEKAVDDIRKTIQKTREETRRLIGETRRTVRGVTPRPVRNWMRERLRRK